MSLQEYLYSLLGKSESQKLEKALKTKKIVLIRGDNGTGKTTLANVLNKFGYHAVEDFEIYEVTLQKPLNNMIPNMKEVIFSEQEKQIESSIMWRRVSYKGTKEQLPKVEAILKESNVDRKIMYLILKYFEINPDAVEVLEKEFSDV